MGPGSVQHPVETPQGLRSSCPVRGEGWGLCGASHYLPAPSPQGSFKELLYVFWMLKDAGLVPDLQSYAAALQCMGRRDQDAGTIRR